MSFLPLRKLLSPYPIMNGPRGGPGYGIWTRTTSSEEPAQPASRRIDHRRARWLQPLSLCSCSSSSFKTRATLAPHGQVGLIRDIAFAQPGLISGLDGQGPLGLAWSRSTLEHRQHVIDPFLIFGPDRNSDKQLHHARHLGRIRIVREQDREFPGHINDKRRSVRRQHGAVIGRNTVHMSPVVSVWATVPEVPDHGLWISPMEHPLQLRAIAPTMRSGVKHNVPVGRRTIGKCAGASALRARFLPFVVHNDTPGPLAQQWSRRPEARECSVAKGRNDACRVFA